MLFFRSHAGFNITGNKIQLVEIDYKETGPPAEQAGFYLENVDEEFFTGFLDLSFTETKIINILQNAFNELILRKPLETNYVSFTFPHNFFKIFQLPVDSRIASADLKDHLKWEVSVLYPDYDPDTFIIRHIENLNDSDQKVKRAVVFAALKKYLKVIHKFCVRNNLILNFIDNAHIAADAFLLNKSVDQTVASVLIDEKLFSISVLKNKQLEFFKTFEIDSIAEFPGKLNEEIGSLQYFKNREAVTSIYISGNFISENLLTKLHEVTDYDFLLINPFDKLKVSQSLKAGDFINNKSYSFTSAAGIALRLV